jgi:hypothetical protein
LALHFHLGVLILLDTFENQHSVPLEGTFDISSCRLASTRAIVNLINLMLLHGETCVGDNAYSIILKDPYPEHTRNGISRAASSVLRLIRTLALKKPVGEIMAAPLFTA